MAATLADRLSRPLASTDGPNLLLQDRLNRVLPWLWWPVGPPAPEEPMRAPAHALYAAHAWLAARALGVPRRAPWLVATALSWAAFSGAWDRRAARLRPR